MKIIPYIYNQYIQDKLNWDSQKDQIKEEILRGCLKIQINSIIG